MKWKNKNIGQKYHSFENYHITINCSFQKRPTTVWQGNVFSCTFSKEHRKQKCFWMKSRPCNTQLFSTDQEKQWMILVVFCLPKFILMCPACSPRCTRSHINKCKIKRDQQSVRICYSSIKSVWKFPTGITAHALCTL